MASILLVHARHKDMHRVINTTHAVRLGFRQIAGFSKSDAERIQEARDLEFSSLRDFWLRTRLSTATLKQLAQADTFVSLGLNRREVLWEVRALRRTGGKDDLPLFARAHLADQEPDAQLPPMPPGEQVIEDYRHLHLSVKVHPLVFLRKSFDRRDILPNGRLSEIPSGKRVRVAGLVLVRQRPGSAQTIFMTIEDETGNANIIVWPHVFDKFRAIVMGARLIAVTGKLQNESNVLHIVAERLEDITAMLADLSPEPGTPATRTMPVLVNSSDAARSMPKGRNFH